VVAKTIMKAVTIHTKVSIRATWLFSRVDDDSIYPSVMSESGPWRTLARNTATAAPGR